MNLLHSFVASPVAEAIGWALLHSLWEGAFISGVLGATLVAFRSPRARYIAACAAMLAMLAAFASTLAWVMPEATHGIQIPTVSALPMWSGGAVKSTRISWETRLELAVPWLAPIWIIGVLLIDLRCLAGCVSVRKLRRRGVCCASSHWQNELTQFRAQVRISRPVKLLESCLADVPVVLGHFRPLILVPAGLLAGLPQGQIEAILLHELAHIRRHDYLVNVVQRFVESLFFYHPAVWWFSRLIRIERENCCDDIVVSISGNAHQYAAALTTLEQNRVTGRVPAMAATGGNLVKRIRRLLYPKPNSALAPFLAAGILAATAVVSLASWKATSVQHQASAAESSAEKALPPAYAKWIEGPISYIIEPQEKAAFLRLTANEERDEFIKQFWARRNPNPGSPENAFKKEFYRRVAFANKHFATSGIPGWKTDRGHVYMSWGPPDEIQKHGKGFYGPYAMETWYYRYIPSIGHEQGVTFVDRTGNGDFRVEPGVRLPSSQNSVMKMPSESVVVTITKPQTLYVGNQPVNIQELGSIVQKKLAGNPNTPVYVRADDSVPYGTVLAVLNGLKQSHVPNVHLVTRPLETKAHADHPRHRL